MAASRPRTDSKWWGWGDAGHLPGLPAAAAEAVRSELGIEPGDAAEHVPIADVRLSEPRDLPAAVIRAVGRSAVHTDHETRVRHAAGKSYADLIRMRTGAVQNAPDAVLVPADSRKLAAVLRACSKAGVAVVPFGGGSSVVGGVEALAGPHKRVVSLDLCALRDVEIDERSLTARLGPGLRGPEAEAKLARAGLTLGHFPQSFQYATIGGFAATRSAGQSSSGYGRFDDLVTAVELATPVGPLKTLDTPHTAAGPALREVVLGSEGTLGVIGSTTCRVRRAPEARRYEAWIAESFEAGTGILREMAQHDEAPTVLRLSDEEETRISLQLAGTAGIKRTALDAYLALRRRRGGCLMICGWEGDRGHVRSHRAAGHRRLRAGGAVSLGASAGSSWERGRFEGPYLRDALMDLGVMVETLETSHTWTQLPKLYAAVGKALRKTLGPRSIVMCHVSHTYRDGASLYFTFLTRADRGKEIAQWRRAKQAAGKAITGVGGTITHHHAVGTDHAPFMRSEVGKLGLEAIAAVKERLDPEGVMNPGKLLP